MNNTELRKIELIEAQREYYKNPIYCRVCKDQISFRQWKQAHYRDDVFCGKVCQMAWLSRLNADRVRL